jgi:hypothetical protein
MTANDPGRRAGHIEQDAIEETAVPPRFRLRGIAGDQMSMQSEARQILLHALESSLRHIDREQLREFGLQLEQVTRLAARRCTRIENSLPCSRRDAASGELSSCVLNGHQPLIEAR